MSQVPVKHSLRIMHSFSLRVLQHKPISLLLLTRLDGGWGGEVGNPTPIPGFTNLPWDLFWDEGVGQGARKIGRGKVTYWMGVGILWKDEIFIGLWGKDGSGNW